MDSLFEDSIAQAEMPKRLSFPNMKLYDGTIDPTDHITSYKQRMFTTAIPRDLYELSNATPTYQKTLSPLSPSL